METKDIAMIIECIKKIKECDEVITYFKMNHSLYKAEFISEVVTDFEKIKKSQIAKIKMLHLSKKLREAQRDEEE
jgi:hypothetical protein